MRTLLSFLVATLAAPLFATERIPSHCLAFAEREQRLPVQYASTRLAEDEVAISYVGHSMYRIDTYGGLTAVTDFNGGVPGPLDVVTMNHGHSSHYTNYIRDDISYALRGWVPEGGVADHNLDLGEMLIRNVTTDIRSRYTGIEPDGNSIFIFEVAGLCIGHLGHLHHVPTEDQFARIGRLDIVMAAVDGGVTLDTARMVETLKRIRALVVLPMHWWGRSTLEAFVDGMRSDFAVTEVTAPLVMSLDLLPREPTIMIMQPAQVEYLGDD